MESSPNEKAPEPDTPEVSPPEEFTDLDGGEEQEPAVTAERMDNVFKTPLSEDAEAFKKMWTRVEGFLGDEEKWKNDPVVRSFKLAADRASGEGGDDAPLETLKDSLQEYSVEETIKGALLQSDDPIGDDVKALYVFGRILNREFAGDNEGGAVLNELGKRIELAVTAKVLAMKEARGEGASYMREKIERQLTDGKEKGDMSGQFRRFIRDIASSTGEKPAALEPDEPTPPSPPKTVEKEKVPVTPWMLGVEKTASPETTARVKRLHALLLPKKGTLENPEKKSRRAKLWDTVMGLLKKDDPYSGSVFMRMTKREGGLKKNIQDIDAMTQRLQKTGLMEMRDPSKLSRKELRTLRLTGLLLLQAGYENKQQKDFSALSEKQKLMVRTGEIIGMVAEGDMIRRMMNSKNGLDEARARAAHKRF